MQTQPGPTQPIDETLRKQLIFTNEQRLILGSTGNIRINAVAGSGKTTTIIQYAATRPQGAKILYLAFNKSVRIEARKKFDEKGLHHVQVETAHSLAYKKIVSGSGYKVRPQGYTTYEIAELLGLKDSGEKHGAFILANHIVKFMAYFCNSDVQKVNDLDYARTLSDAKAKAFVNNFYPFIINGTRQLLKQMKDGSIDITHDFYLKLYQLSQPVLPHDFILFDEGQDASPAMLDVFLKQQGTKVIVGDTHQQIYAWRHAVNSLAKADFANYCLSTSFRFPQAIASLATEVLLWKNHIEETQAVRINGSGTAVKPVTKATLARTNLGLLLRAISYITRYKEAKHLYFEGNINSYTYADDGASLYDVLSLYNGQHYRIRDKLIQTMKTMYDLEEYIEKTEDMQLAMMLEIVNQYGNAIPGLLKELKSKHVDDADKYKAEMVFSTVHRCKGMEYDAVQIADDFITEAALEKEKGKKPEEKTSPVKLNEEINLLYVAITRAKSLLRIPEKLMPKNFPASSHIKVLPTDETPVTDEMSSRYKPKEITTSYLEKRKARKTSTIEWTSEKDEVLRRMFKSGAAMRVLANHFHCRQRGIVTRLKILGCVEEE